MNLYTRPVRSSSSILAAAVVSASLSLSAFAVSYADGVVHYAPGSSAAPGYQTPSAALGEPSRVTPFGPVDAPVTPFNPAWAPNQLVSIGQSGSLTLHTESPVQDGSGNPFGIDFILFGNNGLMVTDFSVPEAEWTTDGALFNFDIPGASKVWVSQDNQDYFELVVPAGRVAMVDGYFPTDGQGSFSLPVDPVLGEADFKGKTLEGLRALYAGSAGGTGFDLAWARRSDGTSAGLTSASYVRIDVLQGKVEVDGLAVVPEPGAVAFVVLAGLGFSAWRRVRRCDLSVQGIQDGSR